MTRRVPLIYLWLIVAVLLFGFLRLVYHLDALPLWSDEGWTVAASEAPTVSEIINDWVIPDVHPPLYFLQLHVWFKLTGDSVFEMRYPAVLASMLGLAVMYRLGEALYNRRAGFIAMLLYALHDMTLVMSQEVRHYSQQMTLVMLVMWLYWRWHQLLSRNQGSCPEKVQAHIIQKGRNMLRPYNAFGLSMSRNQGVWGRGALFAVTGAVLLYTHYWGGFVLLALALHALIVHREQWKQVFVVLAGMALMFAPWLPVVIQQVTMERASGLGLGHALPNEIFSYAVILYQLIGIPEWFWIILGVAGAFNVLLPRPRLTHASVLPLLVIVVTVGLSILLNIAYPVLTYRSLAVIVPPAVLLAGYAISQFSFPAQGVLLAFAVLYGLTSTSAGPMDRARFPDIVHDLAQNAAPGDLVLLETDFYDDFVATYYIREENLPLETLRSEYLRAYEPEQYAPVLDAALAENRGVWIIKLGWPDIEYDPRNDLIARGFEQIMPEFDYGLHFGRPVLMWHLQRPS